MEHTDQNLRSASRLLIINQLFADSRDTTLLRERAERVRIRALLVFMGFRMGVLDRN